MGQRVFYGFHPIRQASGALAQVRRNVLDGCSLATKSREMIGGLDSAPERRVWARVDAQRGLLRLEELKPS